MWNAYGSWYRNFLWNDNFAAAPVTEAAQKALVEEWVRSLKVSIPVLGIEAGVGDGAIVGSVSLYIICIWVLLSMRRENHIIGVLLRETKGCEPSIRRMVFHGIVSFSVFTIVSNFNDPIEDLDSPPKEKSARLIRWTYVALILLPAITTILLFAADWLSILKLSAPLRAGHMPLWQIMTISDWGKRGVMEALCLALFFLTLYLCVRTIRYNDGTQEILKQYEGKFSADEQVNGIDAVTPAGKEHECVHDRLNESF
jgi:hypothetical protein